MKLPPLDLTLLHAFDALIRERHVTRAAERLEVGQSSMSASLAKLRDLFQDELLMRTGAGLVPTERAVALLPRVQEAIAAMERVMEPSEVFDPASAERTFRLIVIDYIDLLVMPHLLRRVRQEAPRVKIHMLQTNPNHFGEMMAAGDLDLAITYFPGAPEYLKGRNLFSDRFVTMCGQQHPAAQATLDVAGFCALPHVTIEPDFSQIYNVQIDTALRSHGVMRNVQMIKPSFLALPFLLEATDMVSCVPVRLARRMTHMANINLFDIPLELPTFDVRMLWHPRTQHSPAHEWLRRLVIECAQAV